MAKVRDTEVTEEGLVRLKVLDKGYLAFVESWGSDERIIEAARMSTGKGFRSWYPYYECTAPGCDAWWFEYNPNDPQQGVGDHSFECLHAPQFTPRYAKVGDEGLLKFLWDKQHTTPFEMGGMIVESQAPIMVYREWHRHRTQSYNEASARYSPLPAIDYLPSVPRLMRGAGKNKQAQALSGTPELTVEAATGWLRDLENLYKLSEATYQTGLQAGVPKELARLALTVGRYSKMRASANLLNWLKFVKLRYAPDAQYEIACYAEVVKELLTERFPRTMALLNLPALDL